MSWTSESVRSEVLELLRGHAGDGSEVKPESQIVADLGIDSLGVMEIIADLEDKFEISIPDEALREVETIADVAVAIEKKLKVDGRLA